MPHQLLLLRHAKSNWDDASIDDHSRPLSKRGREAAKTMAAYLKREGLRPDLIFCSTAERTRRTADPIKANWPSVPMHFDAHLYLASIESLVEVLNSAGSVERVLVIGHNPTMESFAHYVVDKARNQNTAAMANLSSKYPTAALAVINLDISHWSDIAKDTGQLERFVKPRDIGP